MDDVASRVFRELAYRWGRLWVGLMYVIVGLNIWHQTTTWLSRGLATGFAWGVLTALFVPVGRQLHKLIRVIEEQEVRDAEIKRRTADLHRAHDLREAWATRREVLEELRANVQHDLDAEADFRHLLERLRRELDE